MDANLSERLEMSCMILLRIVAPKSVESHKHDIRLFLRLEGVVAVRSNADLGARKRRGRGPEDNATEATERFQSTLYHLLFLPGVRAAC